MVSKYDDLASVPALGRRLFLWSFTPFHLRFRHLLPVFQDDKARGGIRRNGSKDSSQVSRRAVFSRGPNGAVSGSVKLKSGLQRLGCCSPTSALPRSDRWRGTRLFLAPPDLAVSSPGFHRGRIPISAISVLEGRVEDDEVVVQVRIPPVAEPPVLVAEYSFFHYATSEQRSSDRWPLGKMVGGKGPACFANA